MDSSLDRSLAMAHLSAVAFSSPLAVIASAATAEALRATLGGVREQPFLPAFEAQAFASELNTVQWIRPQLLFSEELTLYWGETSVELLSVPSVTPGACWIHLAKERLLFVGDSVASQTPPYLGEASFEAWLEALARLRRPPFRECRLFCSRAGWVSARDLARSVAFVKGAQRRYLALAARKAGDVSRDLGRAAASLVAGFGVSPERRPFAQARTRLGLLALWEREHGPLAEKPASS
jgi:glyoxylase-like metal-dependent hydrolase (beta-lactamase superfamily II)